jgi:hypothetical protein
VKNLSSNLQKIAIIFLIIFNGILFSGCTAIVVGSAVGAIGGYALSRDTVAGYTDKDYEDIWDATLEVANSLGMVKKQDRIKGTVQFNIGTANLIVVSLEKTTARSSRVKVAARKNHFPDLKTAEKVFIMIMDTAK